MFPGGEPETQMFDMYEGQSYFSIQADPETLMLNDLYFALITANITVN